MLHEVFCSLWGLLFQSIYTYKRRWNTFTKTPNFFRQKVSIHLYLQEALELNIQNFVVYLWYRFNPFIPTRGVGIGFAHAALSFTK